MGVMAVPTTATGAWRIFGLAFAASLLWLALGRQIFASTDAACFGGGGYAPRPSRRLLLRGDSPPCHRGLAPSFHVSVHVSLIVCYLRDRACRE